MIELNNQEKLKIVGGAFNFNITALIGTAISFIFGLIDGVINPDKCKS